MAEDIVVKEPLTTEMKEAGIRLLEQLDATEWRPPAALWFFVPEAGRWRLLLADPELETTGPKHAYGRVLEALNRTQVPEGALGLGDIAVIDSDDPLLRVLRRAVPSGPGTGAIRFSKSAIEGTFIEDALIYRLT